MSFFLKNLNLSSCITLLLRESSNSVFCVIMICWRWWNCVIGIQSRVESTLERESWTEFFWLQDRGSKTVLILESMSCIPDSRYWISLSLSQWNLESGFQSLLGFCYSHSCIPDSKAQYSAFHKYHFSWFLQISRFIQIPSHGANQLESFCVHFHLSWGFYAVSAFR